MRVENLAQKAVTWVTLLSFFSAFVLTPQAYANPEGGVVNSGSATITVDGTKTNIVQSTNKAVIDWRSFDINANEHTQFYQPGASSITLNRINDYKPSQIDGQLTANGKIILINPNGVFFGAGSVVDVNSLLATSADIDNNNFIKNDVLHFDKAGNADAAIINNGTITAAEAGLIGFVAPQVENNGVITAKLGKVQLASGEAFTMDLAGDGLVNLAVSENMQKQIVKNSGVISANGGEIHMTAAVARNQVDRLIENTGRLEAKSFAQKGGKIVLMAQGTGAKKAQVLNKGTIDVSAAEDKAAGGKVEVLGDHVGLMENSKILASGQNANGGDVKVGGDYQGLGPTQRADITYVAPNTLIDVRANGTGNGGRAIIWADDTTRYYGMIDGRGGDLGGNGGMAEVSGQSYLDFLGNVDLSALNGERGHLLLDPGNIIICQFGVTAGCNPSPTPALTAAANVFTSTATDSYVNIGNAATAGSLVALLQSADVTIATGGAGASVGNITVADTISWTAANTLTLNAHGQIIINAPVTGNGIAFISDGDVAINAALTPTGTGTTLSFTQKTASRTIGVGGGAGTINISNADIANISANWGGVYFGNGNLTGKLTVGTVGNTLNLPFSAVFASSVTVAVPANLVTIDGNIVMQGKNISIAANNPVINGTITTTGGGVLSLYGRNGATTTCVARTGCGTNYSAAMLDKMAGSWARIDFGQGGADAGVFIGDYTFSNHVRGLARNATVSVTGNVDMNGNNLDLIATRNTTSVSGTVVNANNMSMQGSTSVVISGSVNGTGNITLTNGGSSTGAVQDIAGEVNAANWQLTAASLDKIGAGWNKLIFSKPAANNMNVGAYNWRHNVEFQQTSNHTTSFLGAQDFGGHDVTLTGIGTYAIGAAFAGTGNLIIQGDTAARNLAIGGTGGTTTMGMSTASIANIQAGFSGITIGRSDQTGTLTFTGAQTWKSALLARTLSGTLTTSALTMSGGHDLTIETDSNLTVSGSLAGSGGRLRLRTMSDNANITLGGVGVGTGFTINLGELNGAMNGSGWNEVIVGRETGTGTMNIGSYSSWSNNMVFQSDTGVITVSGDLAFNNGDNVTILTNSDPVISAILSGTGGTLSLRPMNGTLDIGVADGSGTYNISTAELDRLGNNWGSIVFGSSNQTGAINANSYTNWRDPVSFVRNAANTANAINIAGNQTGGNSTGFIFTGNVSLGGNVTTGNSAITFNNGVTLTGNSTLNSGSALTTLQGVTAGSYAFALAGSGDTQLNGDITSTNTALDLSRNMTLANNVTLSSGTGAISLKAINAGTHSLVFVGSGGLNLNGDITSTDVAIDFNRAITLLGNSTLNTGTAAMGLRAVTAGAYTLAFGGTGALNLNGNITSTNTALDFTRDITLLGNSTLNAGTAAISLKNVSAGTNTLAFGGAGGLNVDGSITSTNTALDFSRNMTLTGNSTLNAGTAAISLRNVSAGMHTLAFGGSGGLNIRGNITSIDTALDFNRTVTLTGNSILDAGAADISLRRVAMNGYSLDISGNGGLNLYNNITSTNALLNIGRDATLFGNVTLNTGSGDIYMKDMNMGVYSLAFVGSGGLYLSGDITSTDVALDINRNLVLDDNSHIDTGTADISLRNAILNDKSLTFGGTGNLNLGGNITSADVDIDFNRDIFLAGDTYIDAGAGHIYAKNITAGGSEFTVGGSGRFYLDGDISADGDLYINRDLVLTGNSRIASDGDLYFMSLYADNSNLTFGGAGQNIYLRGSDVFSNGTDIDFRGRSVMVDNNGSNFIIDASAGDIYLDIFDANNADLTIKSGGKLYVSNTMNNGSVGFYANYGSLEIGREIVTNIGDPSIWFEVSSKRGAVRLHDKVTSDTSTSISASSDVYVAGDINSAGQLYISGDMVQLDGTVRADDYADIRGGTQLYLGNNVTATLGDIYLANAKLIGNATIDANAGDIYLDGTTDADAYNLAFAGSGDLYLNGDVRSTDTALDFNRDVYLTNNSYIDAGTADISLGNVDVGGLDLRFGGSGLLNVNGDIYTAYNDLIFDRNIVLLGDSSFNTDGGQIIFNGTMDGAYDLDVSATSDIIFAGAVGDGARLGDVTIANANNVSAYSFKAASFTQSTGTGKTEFTGDGLNTTGDINITAEEIVGTYEGDEGTLNSGSGTIMAKTTFNSLDIDGAGATLTAGAIGTGAVNQAMANRITVGGLTLTSANPLYTFAGFQIGASTSSGGGNNGGGNNGGGNNGGGNHAPGAGVGSVNLPPTVVATISAPSIQLENSFSYTSVNQVVAAACASPQSDVIISDAFFGGSSAGAASGDDEEQDAHKANSISTSAGGVSIGCSV